MIKKSYFQGGGGVNEPAPKKKKYKVEKAIMVQPRFEEPLYRNFDIYNLEGKYGPGAGWNDINNFKSIQEFLKEKRKKLKNKYKADDFYIEDTKENYQERVKKMSMATETYYRMVKNAIDFPIDDQIKSFPILTDNQSYTMPFELGPTGNPDFSTYPTQTNIPEFESYPASAQIGGRLDRYLPNNDFEGKSPDQLDFGRDYTDEGSKAMVSEEQLIKLLQKYLPSPNQGEFGLPDGVNPENDENLGNPNAHNPYFGTTDLGIDIYEDKWNI